MPARPSPLVWFFEPLERDAGYRLKRMFGCDAAYVDGTLYLVVADQDEPWNGLMVCTSKDRHAALVEEMPALHPHPVLGKWLYISQSDPAFESVIERLVSLVRVRDERIGVAPKPRKPRAPRKIS